MQKLTGYTISLAKVASVGFLVFTSVPVSLSLLTTTAMSADLKQMLPEDIQAAGEITVASDTNFAPYEYVPSGSNTPIGLDVDIANALGTALGVRFRFISTAFDGIIPALQAGRYNVGISAINDTAEREGAVDMVNYMVNPGSSATVLVGNPKNIRNEQDLCGKTVAVLSGTTQEKELQQVTKKCENDGVKPIKILPFPEASSTYLALQSGQADAAVTGGIAAAYQVEQSKGAMEAVELRATGLLTSIAVAKGNDKLVAALKAGLERMRQEGSYATILEKWGSSKYALEEFTVNAAGSAAK
jgi:polar amino acid transport system substrate-binding protein